MKTSKPHAFAAREKPFTVEIGIPCVISGYTKDDRYASFYKPIPIKKGDTFRLAPGGILLNGVFVQRRARRLRKTAWRIAWVAKHLRVAVFLERDRIWNRRTKKPTNRFGKPYWVACDLRSYHIGTGDDVVLAMQALLRQCQGTHLLAEEEKAKGNRVIRWRCLLPKNEMKEMESKARKTGFILDGVEVPPLPKKWQEGLKRLKKA